MRALFTEAEDALRRRCIELCTGRVLAAEIVALFTEAEDALRWRCIELCTGRVLAAEMVAFTEVEDALRWRCIELCRVLGTELGALFTETEDDMR